MLSEILLKTDETQIKQQLIRKVGQRSAADMDVFIQHFFELCRQIRQHPLDDRGQIVDENAVRGAMRRLDAVAVLFKPVPAVIVLFHGKRIEIAVRNMILPMKRHKVLERALFIVEEPVQGNDADLRRVVIRIEIDAERYAVDAVYIVIQRGHIL